MKHLLVWILLTFASYACHKSNTVISGCDILNTYAQNAQKVTITKGVWGTVSSMEGNCMPMVPPATNTCKHCAVQRTIKVYPYTLKQNATLVPNTASFYESFNVPAVAEITADANGFYEINLPNGQYSLAIVENGKLYASGLDGQGGINPVTINGGIQKVNLIMTYKAVF